jgi:plasmid maintenance system antidote protein VapI
MDEKDHTPPRDSALLEKVGRTLHGEGWIKPLAESLGVTTSALYALTKGDRTVTPTMRGRLLALVRDAPERLGSKLAQDLAVLRTVDADLVAKGDVVDPKPPDRVKAPPRRKGVSLAK